MGGTERAHHRAQRRMASVVLTGNPGSPGMPSGPCNTEGQRGSSAAALPGQQEPAPRGSLPLAPPKGPRMSPPSGAHDPFHRERDHAVTQLVSTEPGNAQKPGASAAPSGLWAPQVPASPTPKHSSSFSTSEIPGAMNAELHLHKYSQNFPNSEEWAPRVCWGIWG